MVFLEEVQAVPGALQSKILYALANQKEEAQAAEAARSVPRTFVFAAQMIFVDPLATA
jgi:hypothetical protein